MADDTVDVNDRDDLEELRDLFVRALRQNDDDAIKFVAAEAALGVVASDLQDAMGDDFKIMVAEATELRGALDV